MTIERCKNIFPTMGVPHAGALLSTSSQNRKITAVRFRSQRINAFHVPAEATFVAKMRVQDVEDEAATPATLSIIDLRNGALCRKDSPFHELYVHVPQAALDHIATEAKASPVIDLRITGGSDTADPIVRHMRTCLVETTERPNTVSQLFVDYTLMALVTHLARTYGGMRECERRLSGGLATWQERRARDMIASNLTRDLSLDQIARECNLSTPHFSRAFKQSTGFTPHGWLQECRVQHAKSLLSDAELPLANIAMACGFADQSHFTKVFSRMTGSTPGHWRRCSGNFGHRFT